MASSRQRVRFDGIIRGEGYEAECTGRVTMVSLSGRLPTYTQYSIDAVSKALPDGEYTVFAHGTCYPVRQRGGYWLAPF